MADRPPLDADFDAAARELAAENKARRVNVRLNGERARAPDWVDLVDFIAEPLPDRDWVIEDLIERQGRILLAADEGSGKSLISLTLAVQLAAGVPVLDTFGVKLPRRVVYLDLEMARSSVLRRVRELQTGAAVEREMFRLLLRPDGVDLTEPRERAGLQRHFEEFRPDLLVVDPFYKLSRGDTMRESEVKPALLFLDHIRHHVGAAVVLVHHLRKPPSGESSRRLSSDVFGASALRWWPEAILIVDRDRSLVSVRKDRDAVFGDIRSFSLRFPATGWPVSFASPLVAGMEEVHALLADLGPLSGNELHKERGGRRTETLDVLRQLEAAGRVVRAGRKWEAVE